MLQQDYLILLCAGRMPGRDHVFWQFPFYGYGLIQCALQVLSIILHGYGPQRCMISLLSICSLSNTSTLAVLPW